MAIKSPGAAPTDAVTAVTAIKSPWHYNDCYRTITRVLHLQSDVRVGRGEATSGDPASAARLMNTCHHIKIKIVPTFAVRFISDSNIDI